MPDHPFGKQGPPAEKREEKLLRLLRTARPPRPSPEYLAEFWPRLRGRLGPRRPAVLHPLYYGGLAAAAAALVLWVTLGGTDLADRERPGFPAYALATANSPAAEGQSEMSYISGPARRAAAAREDGTDYVLPRAGARDTERLEV